HATVPDDGEGRRELHECRPPAGRTLPGHREADGAGHEERDTGVVRWAPPYVEGRKGPVRKRQNHCDGRTIRRGQGSHRWILDLSAEEQGGSGRLRPRVPRAA